MRTNAFLCLLCLSVSLTLGLRPSTAEAAGFTIRDGETFIQTQQLNAGETGRVEAGGRIVVGSDFAIEGLGNGVTIENAGAVSGPMAGILVQNDSLIVNSGTVTGVNLHGIIARDGNTIINSATVIAEDTSINAGSSNMIRNSGQVQGNWNGISANNNNNTIINSGSIIGGTNAVLLDGTGNTLKLRAGSNIQGNLALGGSTNKLIIGRGLDTALSFTGTPTVEVEGGDHAVIGNTVYAVSGTSFSVQDEIANDLTRAVSGAVEGRLSAARLSGGGLSVAMGGVTIAAAADAPDSGAGGLWLSTLGAWRDQAEDGGAPAFTSSLAGLVAGVDAEVGGGTRAGVFAGYAAGDLDAANNALDLGSDSAFGGFYLGHDGERSFLNLSLAAGSSSFDSARRVANNRVAGGIERAKADYDGLFVSPSLTLGTALAAGSGTLTPSLRLRYTGLFLDGYSETGSAAALDVEDRTITILDARAELAYAFAAIETAGGDLFQSIRLGVDGSLASSSDVSAELGIAALGIDVAEDELARGYLGYGALYALSEGVSLTLSAEAGYDTTQSLTLQGKAGLGLTF
jgi:uncharacterized protein with beta-barrel porin domain